MFLVLIINVVIIGLNTFSALSINSNVSRYLGTGLDRYNEIAKGQALLGDDSLLSINIKCIGSYGYFNSIPFLICSFLMFSQVCKKIIKIIVLGIILFLVFVSIKASYLTCILLEFFVLFLYCVQRLVPNKSSRVIVFIMMLLFGIFAIVSGIASSLVERAAYLIDNQVIFERLIDIAGFLRGDLSQSIDLKTRFELAWTSISNFFSSPIFGSIGKESSGRIGGHSTMLDLLACYGVFGFLYIGFWIKICKCKNKNTQESNIKKLGNLYLILIMFLDSFLVSQMFIGYFFFLCIGISVFSEYDMNKYKEEVPTDNLLVLRENI